MGIEGEVVSHRIIIADGLRAVSQNQEVRQEMAQEQCQNLDACLADPEPSDNDLHRALRILGRVYSCGD